jgi:hypothetical protein
MEETDQCKNFSLNQKNCFHILVTSTNYAVVLILNRIMEKWLGSKRSRFLYMKTVRHCMLVCNLKLLSKVM